MLSHSFNHVGFSMRTEPERKFLTAKTDKNQWFQWFPIIVPLNNPRVLGYAVQLVSGLLPTIYIYIHIHISISISNIYIYIYIYIYNITLSLYLYLYLYL